MDSNVSAPKINDLLFGLDGDNDSVSDSDNKGSKSSDTDNK